MKITLFGATGKLGRECLAQCVEAGHAVTVLVRSPDKLPRALRRQGHRDTRAMDWWRRMSHGRCRAARMQ